MTDSTTSRVIAPHHTNHLSLSAIHETTAVEYGVRSALTPQDLPDGAPTYWANLLPGLLFPWTGQSGHVEWQLRPDTTTENSPKYVFRSVTEGYIHTPWVLRTPAAGAPVLFVEGTKQALCVAEHAPDGYGVVGLAGCWGGQHRGLASPVLSLAKGRDAVVVLDADVQFNTQVFAAGANLRTGLIHEGATSVRLVRTLAGGTHGIDDVLGARSDPADHLARLINSAVDYKYPKGDKPKPRPGSTDLRMAGTVPPPTDAAPCARAYMAVESDSAGTVLVRYWREQWVRYETARGCWTVQDDRDYMKTQLFQAFEHAVYAGDNGPTPWNPGPASVTAVEMALKAFTSLPANADVPGWLAVSDGRTTRDPRMLLAFPNGILEPANRVFTAPDANLFTLYGLPFHYDPRATLEGTRWHQFLGEVFPSDAESVCRLQEVMGYLVSGRVDLEKLFLFVGLPRAGKGTVGEVLRQLMGGSAVGTSIDGLSGGTFALESLLDKRLAIVGDARVSADPQRISTLVERLLSISGGDAVRVERKFRGSVNNPLRVNFLIMSNEDLIVPESSGAAAGRFEIIEFGTSFRGREDPGLKRALAAELPAILNWALDGLDRLNRQGGLFTQSDRSRQASDDMRLAGAPVMAFAEERLVFDPSAWTDTKTLYDAWCAWAFNVGMAQMNSSHFSRALKSAYGPAVARTRKTSNDRQVWGYSGIRLVADGVGYTK